MVAISPVFGLEGFRHRHHRHVHGTQHVGQHMVGLDLQVVGLQFDGYVAVAQVVGGAGQVKGRAVFCASGDAQHGLRRGLHPHQRAVFGHQHITAAHHGATGQEHTQGTALAVGGAQSQNG